ncbi:MAG: nucleoside phosphorylase [Proteobacteria bacterium]|nr:nucleoside phosphorylase [Pseudomonadota bacterium]
MVRYNQEWKVENPTFLRIGTCGALQPGMEIRDLAITTGSLRMEDTSLGYVPAGYPTVAHHQMVQTLIETASAMKSKYHVGITACASGFYGAQGRTVGKFKSRYPNLVEELSGINVVNMEMESSTLLTMASLQNYRAGVVFVNRLENKFIETDKKLTAEELVIETGLKTIARIMEQDKNCP